MGTTGLVRGPLRTLAVPGREPHPIGRVGGTSGVEAVGQTDPEVVVSKNALAKRLLVTRTATEDGGGALLFREHSTFLPLEIL